MVADKDYYSGAFLDWFPGNIQDLNSISGVLQCPPAAMKQYNETASWVWSQSQYVHSHRNPFSLQEEAFQ